MYTVRLLPGQVGILVIRGVFAALAMILILASAPMIHLYSQAANAKMIPAKQAEHLLRIYLRSQGYDKKNAPINIELARDSGRGSYANFYLYGVYVDTPQRLVTLGSYGVNGKTGDIWERIECKRIESGSITALQKRIRDSSGLSESELDRLRSIKPCFDEEGVKGKTVHGNAKRPDQQNP